MMPDLPSLRALHYFQHAACVESFSMAAEALNVTHSAISHQIKNLEGWLGVTLFTRSNGRVYLTPEGEQLKSCCNQVFSHIRMTCQQIKNKQQSSLTIACAPSFLAQWLIPRINRFNEKHPEIALNFQTDINIELIQNERVDVLIKSNQLALSSNIDATLITVDYIGPVCSREFSHRFSYDTDFSTLPLLHADTKVNAWQEWAQKTHARGDFFTGKHFDNLTLAIQAAKNGLGITMTPQMLVKKELQEGSLIAPLGFSEVDRATYMLVKSTRNQQTEIQIFRQWLLEEASQS
jgi:LysR family glycine cleavage system transcriptional activator